MPAPSLAIPILLGGLEPEPGTVHFEPTHIATWPSSSKAGPSRRIALAAPDNTIWVYPCSDPDLPIASKSPSSGSAKDLPQIRATSPTPSATPRASRPVNPRVSSFSNRSRAPSSASSTRTSSSRHRITSFSPPSTAQPVTTTLSPTTTTVSATDGHARGNSLSERAELLDHLREQQARNSEDGRSHVGLGINFGRKVEAHGQVDHDKTSGATSPKSAKSNDSQRTSIGGRLMGWATGTDSGDERSKKELDEQVAEIAVDREMDLETERDTKQEEEMKTFEDAIARASPTKSPASRQPVDSSCASVVRRIVLGHPGHGRITSMEAYQDLGLLCVLRDIGVLEIFNLEDLSPASRVNLEEHERKGEAEPSKQPLRLMSFWQWKGMYLAQLESVGPAAAPILALDGLPWSCGQPSHNGDVTRVILLSFSPKGGSTIESRLNLPGQGSIGLANVGSNTFLLHSTQTSLTSYTIRRGQTLSADRPPRPSSTTGVKQTRAISSAHPSPHQHLAAPSSDVEQPLLRSSRSVASLRDTQSASPAEHKSFAKFLAAKKADWRGEKPEKEEPKDANAVQLGEGREVERDGGGSWDRIVLRSNGDGLGIVNDAIDTFSCDGTKLRILKTITLDPGEVIEGATFSSGHKMVCVTSKTGLRTYDLVSENNYNLRNGKTLAAPSAIRLDTESRLWTAGPNGLEVRSGGNGSEVAIVLKRGDLQSTDSISNHIVSSTGGNVWVSDKDGNVARRTLSEAIAGDHETDDGPLNIDRLASTIICMRSCALGSRRYLVAGDEDGTVRIWDDSSAQLLGSWTLFADPIRSIAIIDVPEAGVLQDHLICLSQEGTIGVISLTQMEHLYLIPASRGPLRRIFVSGTDILLAYANGKARLWNVETMEFRRSTGLDAADDMLTSASSWKELLLNQPSVSPSSTLSSLVTDAPISSDLGRALICEPRKVGSDLKSLPTPHGLAMLSGLLSLFLTFGIDDDIDETCRRHLGVVVPQSPCFVASQSGTGAVLSYAFGRKAWQLSAHETGLRQLIILSLLRPFLDSKEHEPYAIQVIAHYATGLPEDIVPAELDFFASYYLDPSGDVQQAARMLFNATLDRMSEGDLELLVAQHQAQLSNVGTLSMSSVGQPDGAHSLLMIGDIALHKYQSVNPAALKSVSESILAILKDPMSPHLALAIELCSKGYSIWQTFSDPMDLLRQLFHLSTRKDASTVNAQARLAVLHVASSNPALFMSTLSMDILNAESAEGRNSIMKLCVYMARKKPEVLENGLPRIAEAVVKSLDPNIGKMREDVWQAATVILNELVLAFSTIDFHSGTQKLAVGTHEGAVIMYELKTASRLYVLEPHRGPVSSVTFSPDGRRLLTVSLEEGLVTVWKVGSSLSGFFNVGGPPRQGALGGTGPFKRIPFARLEEGPQSSTSALSDVHVSWPGPRQAKVMVGETAMSFET